MCVFQAAHVCFPAGHIYACAAGECICVCVHGCTSARAACVVSVVYTRVFQAYTHVCLNWTRVSELPM